MRVLLAILMYPNVSENYGNGYKNHLKIFSTFKVDSLTTWRIDMVIGPMIPITKYSIFITREPVSSFSKRNEKK